MTFRWIVHLWVRYKGGAAPAIAVVIAAMLALLRPLQAGAIDVAFYVAAVTALLQAERVVARLVQILQAFFFVDLTAFSARPRRRARSRGAHRRSLSRSNSPE